MTLHITRLNVNGKELGDRFELERADGQEFLIVHRQQNYEFFKKLVNQSTEITLFKSIDDNGKYHDLLAELFDYHIIRFTKYEEVNDFELLLLIEKSDFRASKNFK